MKIVGFKIALSVFNLLWSSLKLDSTSGRPLLIFKEFHTHILTNKNMPYKKFLTFRFLYFYCTLYVNEQEIDDLIFFIAKILIIFAHNAQSCLQTNHLS